MMLILFYCSRHRELEIKEMEEKIAERYKGVPKKTIAVSCRICLRVRVATISELVCVACGKITCTKCGKQDQVRNFNTYFNTYCLCLLLILLRTVESVKV